MTVFMWQFIDMSTPPSAIIRECLSTGYGLRFSTEIFGSKREKTVFHETYRKPVLFLQKSPKISRNLREFTGECNLGILCSGSLSHQTPAAQARTVSSAGCDAPRARATAMRRHRTVYGHTGDPVYGFIRSTTNNNSQNSVSKKRL